MPLSTDKRKISNIEYLHLKKLLDDEDRVAFYVQLHLMTGSQAALDMAEISSSTGFRGGGCLGC